MITIKTRMASDLTDEEKEKFVEVFYEEIGVYDLVEDFQAYECESPCPWSCPWMHGSSEVLVGFTIEECAKNYCEECRDEIRELIEGDIARAEEDEEEEGENENE